jgi:lipid-A-disaccharide synthase
MDREVVKELIQDELTVTNVTKELESILYNKEKIARIKDDYTSLRTLLQQQGNASEKAAAIIIDFLKSTSLQKA